MVVTGMYAIVRSILMEIKSLSTPIRTTEVVVLDNSDSIVLWESNDSNHYPNIFSNTVAHRSNQFWLYLDHQPI